MWCQGRMQDELVQQKAKEEEVNSFIDECKRMEGRISQDIRALEDRWGKYGYRGQRDTQKPASKYGLMWGRESILCLRPFLPQVQSVTNQLPKRGWKEEKEEEEATRMRRRMLEIFRPRHLPRVGRCPPATAYEPHSSLTLVYPRWSSRKAWLAPSGASRLPLRLASLGCSTRLGRHRCP